MCFFKHIISINFALTVPIICYCKTTSTCSFNRNFQCDFKRRRHCAYRKKIEDSLKFNYISLPLDVGIPWKGNSEKHDLSETYSHSNIFLNWRKIYVCREWILFLFICVFLVIKIRNSVVFIPLHTRNEWMENLFETWRRIQRFWIKRINESENSLKTRSPKISENSEEIFFFFGFSIRE